MDKVKAFFAGVWEKIKAGAAYDLAPERRTTFFTGIAVGVIVGVLLNRLLS